MKRAVQKSLPLLVIVGLAAAPVAACHGSADELTNHPPDPTASPDAGADSQAPEVPFEPLTPQVYVPKVKTILTGLPVTDAEVALVTANPDALRGLIDGWLETPEFQARAMSFFRTAFQQSHFSLDDLFEHALALPLLYPPFDFRFRMERSVSDTFARTAWEFVRTRAPFTNVVTTDTYMMSTALMNLYAFVDEFYVADNGSLQMRPDAKSLVTRITLDPASTATYAASVTPGGPSYMTFKVPQPGCTDPARTDNLDGYHHDWIYWELEAFLAGTASICRVNGEYTGTFASQFSDADWNDWRMVKITRAQQADVGSPLFWDIPALRSTNAMALHTRRLGFMGTLAFQSNWATNPSNSERVTANQALIVALGLSVAPENSITTFPVGASDNDHASNPACAGCHQRLDPYRQFFRQSWSDWYGEQTDPAQIGAPAHFDIGGVQGDGSGIDTIAKVLAGHPRFALAWTLKLHHWANNVGAVEDDPEVLRVAKAFSDGNYDFKVLVRELFASPLVTFASGTKTTTTNGVVQTIARRDQYCAALSTRLRIADVCGIDTLAPNDDQRTMQGLSAMVPTDTYYRSYALPTLPTNPDLFFRQSVESMCQNIAVHVVDAGNGSKYTSADSDKAIADFVTTVMGVPPGDDRAGKLTAILADNLQSASATAGASKTDALRSTFVLACISPITTLVGY